MTLITEGRTAARPIALGGLVGLITSRVAAYRDSRRVLKDLEVMEDHVLEDIGLTRADVVRAMVAELGADRMAMLGRARDRRMA